MNRDPGLAWKIPAATLLLLHCATDKDPTLTTSGLVFTDTAPPDSGDDTGVTPTDSGDETGSGGVHAPCERYLACLAATSPESVPAAQSGFGEAGTCWQGGPTEAAQCIDACRAGLAQVHLLYPDEPACLPCAYDDECDLTGGTVCGDAGECVARCVDGGPEPCECREDGDCGDGRECYEQACVIQVVCGDGVVASGEVCDGQAGCDADCKGPAPCTPYQNTGCPGGQVCRLTGDTAGCVDLPPEVAPLGGSCGDLGYSYDTDTDGDEPVACEPGSRCGSYCNSYYDCCVSYCADGGDPCPDGGYCAPLGLTGPFAYLGVCFT